MPKPPTPSTSTMRYSLSIAPSTSAFGYSAALVVTRNLPGSPMSIRTISIKTGCAIGDGFHVPSEPPITVQLSPAVRGAPGGRNAGRRDGARGPPAAHRGVRDRRHGVRAARGRDELRAAHRRGPHLRGPVARPRALLPGPAHGPAVDQLRRDARGPRTPG